MSTSGQPAPPHGSDPAARFNPLADAVNPRWLPSTERSSRRPRCRRARKGYATGGNRRRLLPVPRQSDPFSFKMCCLPDAGETRTIAVWKGSTGHEWPCGFIMHARGGTRTPTPLWDRILNPARLPVPPLAREPQNPGVHQVISSRPHRGNGDQGALSSPRSRHPFEAHGRRG